MSAKPKASILIPLDGSSIGESALLSISPLTEAFDANVTLLHVADSREAATKYEAYLEAHRKGLAEKKVQAKSVVVSGLPAEKILEQIPTGGHHLVAMGTHGRTGLDRVLLGSVAEEVVRRSPAPVLLSRANSRMGKWGSILVALDGTSGSEEIIGDVERLGKALQATVHLVRVRLSLFLTDGHRGIKYEFPNCDSLAYLEGIAHQLETQGVHTLVESRAGMPGKEICNLARELDAGLICMTTHGLPEQAPGQDRSVAAEVIRGAPCPVYVRRMTAVPGSTPSPERSTKAT